MISMPLSSGSFSSSSVRPARPPPNSVLNVSWKLRLIAANASAKRCRVVSSMRLIASLVCAIESTRSLRCVVRNAWRVSSSSNCSIAIMLTGPSRSILPRSAAIASSGREAGRRLAHAGLSHGGGLAIERRREDVVRLVLCLVGRLLGLLRRDCACVGHGGAVAFELFHFGEHVVERRLHHFQALRGKVVQIAFRCRAQHLELRGLGSHRVEHAAGLADVRLLRIAFGGAAPSLPLRPRAHRP